MNDTQWENLLDSLEKRFPGVDIFSEELAMNRGGETVMEGIREIAEFDMDMGTFRVVRESKPAVLGTKFHYSHRQGAAGRTEYIFSDTELVHRLHAYRMTDDGEWEEISSENFSG